MERRETQINDKTYVILLPPVRKAMPLCTQVAGLLGPLLGTLAQPSEGEGMDKFAAAIQKVDPDKIDALFMKAVDISTLTCGKEPIYQEAAFEKHFAQHRSETYQVCVWIVWECVKDFFPQLGDFTQIAKEAILKTQSPSRTNGPKTTG